MWSPLMAWSASYSAGVHASWIPGLRVRRLMVKTQTQLVHHLLRGNVGGMPDAVRMHPGPAIPRKAQGAKHRAQSQRRYPIHSI